MAFNKNKVMEQARKFVEKGQTDRAIKEYLRIVEDDPRDVRVWLKIGDLYAKKGAKAEATDTYLKVAKFYGEQGFYLKAVAVYKQILKLDARLVEVNLKLAELYRQLGLLSDAMQHFEMVAAHFHREGKTKEALATVRQLVDLDPENVATRIKLAELYSKEQMIEEAVTEFRAACDYLRAHNRQDDFIKVAERLLWHRPESHELNRELATLYMRRNDPRRALQKLQLCFKANPRDVETLALLAQAFQALDQKAKTVSVLKELARILDEDGQKDQAADVHRKILVYVPDEPEARAYLGQQPAQAAAAAGRATAPAPIVAAAAAPAGKQRSERALFTNSDLPPRTAKATGSMPLISDAVVQAAGGTSDPELVIEEEVEQEDFAADLSLDDSGVFDSGSVAGEAHAEEIVKILTETDVYVKYGLHQKAIDHLRRVFDLDPDNIEARERLKDIYVSQGREDEAIDELMRLAELAAATDADRAETYLREVLAMDGTYEPAFEVARRFSLSLAEGPEVEIVDSTSSPVDISDLGLGRGDVAPVEDELEFDDLGLEDEVLAAVPSAGTDDDDDGDYELSLEDSGVADPPPPSRDRSAITQEVDIDQVEDMVALEGGDDLELDAGLGPPDFDPEDARAFDAERRAGSDDGNDLPPANRAPSFDLDEADALGAAPMANVGRLGSDFHGPRGGRPVVSPSYAAPIPEPQTEEDVDFGVDEEPAPAPGGAERTVDFDMEEMRRDTEGQGGGGGTSLEDDLDEADFFVSQGLYGEARDILVGLLERYPSHPLVRAKLQDVDAMSSGHERLPSESDTPLPEISSDDVEEQLAGHSSGGIKRPAVMLEKPVEDSDADTHYDLGLAYKEMGLFDEAIRSFQKVQGVPGRAVQCHLMIGMCHREQGNLSEAVQQFKTGLHTPEINNREKHSVYYEIGATYEAMNDFGEAVYFYEMVFKKEPSYRDVAQRVPRLKAQLGKNGDPGPRRRSDDSDVNFDGLLDTDRK